MTGRRKAALLVALGAAPLLAVLMPNTAYAHGSMENPISRIYSCRLENPEQPKTEACRAAIAIGGTQPVYDWNEVNQPNANGNSRTLIPDGTLCSAGRDKYKGFDQARADWTATTLTSGANATLRYFSTAPHRATFQLWVTRNGYNPTQPLAWTTLEAQPFLTVQEPTFVNNGYNLTARLPAGRTGRHLIYLVAQRLDSPEAFYSCSDVIFR